MNPCMHFKAICDQMSLHISSRQMAFSMWYISCIQMWSGIQAHIRLKYTKWLTKEKSYMIVLFVTRHFKKFSNLLPHLVQWNGFSPMWILVCILKKSVVVCLITFECMKCIIEKAICLLEMWRDVLAQMWQRHSALSYHWKMHGVN